MGTRAKGERGSRRGLILATALGCAALVLLVCGGVVAFLFWPQAEAPTARFAIDVPWPGASAAEVDDETCRPAARALAEVQGVVTTVGIAREGSCRLLVETSTEPIPSIEALSASVEPHAPPEGRPIVTRTAEGGRLVYTVRGDVPQTELAQLHREVIAPRLAEVAGVRGVDVCGAVEREVAVRLDPVQLQAHGVDLNAAIDALEADRATIPGGTIDVPGGAVDLAAPSPPPSSPSADAIASTPIRTAGAASVRIGDVATIEEGAATPSCTARIAGRSVIAGQLVFDEVPAEAPAREALASLNAELPVDVATLPPHGTARLAVSGGDVEEARRMGDALADRIAPDAMLVRQIVAGADPLDGDLDAALLSGPSVVLHVEDEARGRVHEEALSTPGVAIVALPGVSQTWFLIGADADIAALREHADTLARDLETLAGVLHASVLHHAAPHEIDVRVDPERARAAGVTEADVVTAIRATIGGIPLGGSVVVYLGDVDSTDSSALEQVVIPTEGGRVPLSAVASLGLRPSEPPRLDVSGTPAIAIRVALTVDANPERVAAETGTLALPAGTTLERSALDPSGLATTTSRSRGAE